MVTKAKTTQSKTAVKPRVNLQTYPIENAVETWLSQYPSYRISLTGEQVQQIFSANILDIDPDYQRGRTTATSTKPSQPVQTRARNRRHIQELYNELASISPNGRTHACWPPIACNARRPDNLTSKVSYSSGTLFLGGDRKLYTFDGWHRVLAILQAVRDQVVRPDWTFEFYVFDAPKEFEAHKFESFNAGGLPVQRSRIKWVHGPFAENAARYAAEFVRINSHFCRLENGIEVFNVETVNGAVGNDTNSLCSYTAIHNGFAISNSNSKSMWDDGDLNPESPADRQLVLDYMNNYWNEIVRLIPQLAFADIPARQLQRLMYPVLMHSATIQSLLWVGNQLLQAYQSPFGHTDLRSKLKELKDNDRRSVLFTKLAPLNSQNKFASAKGKNLFPFFSSDNKAWANIVRADGSVERNDYRTRRQVFNAMVTSLGISKPNSIALTQITASKISTTTSKTSTSKTLDKKLQAGK